MFMQQFQVLYCIYTKRRKTRKSLIFKESVTIAFGF